MRKAAVPPIKVPTIVNGSGTEVGAVAVVATDAVRKLDENGTEIPD